MAEEKNQSRRGDGRRLDNKGLDQRNDQKTQSDFNDWIESLYDPTQVSPDFLTECYEAFKYQGFDRDSVLRELHRVCNADHNIARQLVLLCALRGPRGAASIKLLNGKTPIEMGIPASGMKGTKKLSCARITSGTADLAAFYMKQLNVPKRIHSSPLEAWLQFPSAGSIILPPLKRQQHIEFSKSFSTLIKGEFNDSIYSTMEANAYLDSRLNLF
jgi:hypothetical protein